MKKIIAAMLVASFSAGLFAQSTFVYDYKASIKRLDAKFSKKTAKVATPAGTIKVPTVTESYAVASDVISGYVILPKCVQCTPTGIDSTMEDDFKGSAYITRKGDKFSKKSNDPAFVYKVNAHAVAAVFGAYVNVTEEAGTGNEPMTSIKSANKAWMYLALALPEVEKTVDSGNIFKDRAGSDVPYGFLGFDNAIDTTGVTDPTYILQTGFGTAKIHSTKEATAAGWCSNSTTPGEFCNYVNTISGTLISESLYEGACGVTPMWDVCFDATAVPVTPVNYAVICGTWTLKFNGALSKLADSAKEDAIYKKMKATADVDRNDEESYFNDIDVFNPEIEDPGEDPEFFE